MFLRELRVENLRAIRSAELRLDATTVLIGENDCGLSSLFAALELVLGGEDGRANAAGIRLREFHLRPGETRPAGPLRVTLTFEERESGEWSTDEHAAVRALLPAARSGHRRLVLAAEAEPPPGERGATRLQVRVPGVPEEDAERLVAHVRRTSPLIRVAGGRLTGHGVEDEGEQPRGRARPARVEPAIARLVERIVGAADGLLRGRSADPEELLRAGFEAARELLARRPEHLAQGAGGLAGSVLEILGQAPAPQARRGQVVPPDGDSVAERLGILLLAAALLRRIPAGLSPGCEPLWIVEAPEAHLHPMTLAAVARLLARIRWQKILTTQSGELLARLPLSQIRRIVRHEGRLCSRAVRPRALSREDLRRVGHHLRARRGVAMFARAWLLVEGESESWMLPQLAQVLGHDLDVAGIACIEYAQCGLEPLLRTARELGIEWHLLADGDAAGRSYAAAARRFVAPGEADERVTLLAERDLEHCLWRHGHAEVFLRAAGHSPRAGGHAPSRRVIERALKRLSKPGLALAVIEAAARRGPGGVPAPLAHVIEACLQLARGAPERMAGAEKEPPSPRRSPR